ncbi:MULTISPECIES: undecaprenyl-diphosphatase [Neobacillus]|uniref:Undecaprenyl-diphosphatase n=1 Tax=Neobacillus citreus TaxID=2833578 RepID=A0A942TBC6_9BACI|nr:undecaprenyl-diphosphatase [Neobacillus citreus]MCH6268711.1 undecaprenyl-diphosphatase [Neobacillus citreus]
MSIMEININVFRMINNLGKQYDFLNPPIMAIAEYTLYVLILALVLYLFTGGRKNKVMVICSVFTLLMAEGLGKLAGMLHSNNQPFAELSNVNKLIEKAVDNSFPSDHTMIFFSLCVTFWLFRRGWSFLWILLAVLVGFSRIWVGVHYPGDVLVAAILSIISALVVHRFVPRLKFMQNIAGEQHIPNRTKYEEL